MTDFIALHIILIDYSKNGEKRIEFIERFLDHASFQWKSEIVTNIIKDKFLQLKKKISKTSFENIGKFRNKIAHSMDFANLKIDKNNPDRIFIRIFRKGEVNRIQITYNDVKIEIDRALSILENLSVEVKKMRDKSSQLESLFGYMQSKKIKTFSQIK